MYFQITGFVEQVRVDRTHPNGKDKQDVMLFFYFEEGQEIAGEMRVDREALENHLGAKVKINQMILLMEFSKNPQGARRSTDKD